MIDKPVPFKEAVLYLLKKNPNPQEWDSEEWSRQEPSVRVRSFISARVENARFLDRAQGLLFDYMVGTTEEVTSPNGSKHTLRRIGSRADFVKQMREFMVSEGMVKEEDFDGVNRNDITDIRSSARLKLIFDTNVRQAYGYGKWRQGMSPAVRAAYPAMRLIRESPVGEARIRHAVHEGDVRLKIDFPWWAHYQNDPAIGGFDVPWGPFGFNSGMGQKDESREVAEKLGLLKPGDAPPSAVKLPGLNDNLSASIKGMPPEMRQKLIDELRGGPKPASPEDEARAAAKNARGAAMKRSWKKAVERDDHGEAERIRRLIDDEEEGLPIVVSKDRVTLKSGSTGAGGYDRFSGLKSAEIDDMAKNIFDKADAVSADSLSKGSQTGADRKAELLAPTIVLTPEERLISGSPLEILLAHNSNGQLLKVQLGDRVSVDIPAGLPNDVILTHNHPGGRGPSAQDLYYSLNHPERSMRLVTVNENGETEAFRFKPTRQFPGLEIRIVVAAYNDACQRNGDDAPARRKALELIQRDFPNMFTLEREILK